MLTIIKTKKSTFSKIFNLLYLDNQTERWITTQQHKSKMVSGAFLKYINNLKPQINIQQKKKHWIIFSYWKGIFKTYY